MVRLANGAVGGLPPLVVCWPFASDEEAEEDVEKELDTLGSPAARLGLSVVFVVAEIVSSKELNLVKFIIQPSILRSSRSSVTFCQETLRVVAETASTMTSSGWPGNVLMPSATPVWVVRKLWLAG